MRYFYAKIGKGNSLADQFIKGDTPLGKPCLPIFFEKESSNRDDFLKLGSSKEQGRNFFWCVDNPESSIIIVIHKGKLHIFSPSGNAVFWKASEKTGYAEVGEFVKLLPIQEESNHQVADIPTILSTMTANAYHYTGTFREISDTGNIRAIQKLQDNEILPISTETELLSCLSSIELETLVAKIFEEAGCFVPAYRGGSLKGIDIIARNNSSEQISVGNVTVPSKMSISIQIKRSTSMKVPPEGCDYLISFDRDSGWLLEHIRSTVNTKAWFYESLSWLPEEFLSIKVVN